MRMKYILTYKGCGQPDLTELLNILRKYNVHLLDYSLSPKASMVELDSNQFNAVNQLLKDSWHIEPEKFYKVPGARHTIKS